MAEKPPSTANSTPFTKLESSEARNSAAAAISSGRPIVPRGISDSNICFASGVRTWSCIGVAIGPGCSTFTRIFLLLSSLSQPRAARIQSECRVEVLLGDLAQWQCFAGPGARIEHVYLAFLALNRVEQAI